MLEYFRARDGIKRDTRCGRYANSQCGCAEAATSRPPIEAFLFYPDESEFSRDGKSAFPSPNHRDVGSSSLRHANVSLWRKVRPS
jgi:hypothetical protein